MATAELNGTTTWYEVDGEGPPCLLLHGGLGLDHSLYRATFSPLDDRAQLVFFDHRGNGRSGRPPIDTITIEQLADDAAAIAVHLGHRRVIVVVGHSYRGCVGQELALRQLPTHDVARRTAHATPRRLAAVAPPDGDVGSRRPRAGGGAAWHHCVRDHRHRVWGSRMRAVPCSLSMTVIPQHRHRGGDRVRIVGVGVVVDPAQRRPAEAVVLTPFALHQLVQLHDGPSSPLRVTASRVWGRFSEVSRPVATVVESGPRQPLVPSTDPGQRNETRHFGW